MATKKPLLKRVKAIARFPVSLSRNREFLRHLAAGATSLDAAARKYHFRAAYSHLWTKVLKSDVPEKLEAAKGLAARVLNDVPWVRRHLQATPHFGTLQPLFHPLRIDRLYYVSLQFEIALALKNENRGSGLGSRFGDGSSSSLPKSTTGMELLQLWSVLLSSGHLFGTFATERALAYRFRRQPNMADQFLSQVDGLARKAVEPLVRNGGMHDLSGALAAWRVSRDFPLGDLRNAALSALALYFSPALSPGLTRLRALHARARQTAYQRLQGFCGMVLSKDEMHSELAFVSMAAKAEDIFEDNDIAFAPDLAATTPIAMLFDAVQRYQETELFASSAAHQLVLQHITQFKSWWTQCESTGTPLEERLASLWTKPATWPGEGSPLHHTFRIQLPAPEPSHWVENVRDWLGPADGKAWADSNFLLTHTSRSVVIDFFRPSSAAWLPYSAVLQIAVRLAEHRANDAALSARSIARFGQAVLGRLLNQGLRSYLVPCAGAPAQSLALMGADLSALGAVVAGFLQASKDDQRSAEVRATLGLLNSLVLPSPPRAWLLFTAEVFLVSSSDGDQEQELDGVAAAFFEETVVWYFLEVKARRQRGAAAQLSTIAGMLNVPVAPIVQLTLLESKAAWTMASWVTRLREVS